MLPPPPLSHSKLRQAPHFPWGPSCLLSLPQLHQTLGLLGSLRHQDLAASSPTRSASSSEVSSTWVTASRGTTVPLKDQSTSSQILIEFLPWTRYRQFNNEPEKVFAIKEFDNPLGKWLSNNKWVYRAQALGRELSLSGDLGRLVISVEMNWLPNQDFHFSAENNFFPATLVAFELDFSLPQKISFLRNLHPLIIFHSETLCPSEDVGHVMPQSSQILF